MLPDETAKTVKVRIVPFVKECINLTSLFLFEYRKSLLFQEVQTAPFQPGCLFPVEVLGNTVVGLSAVMCLFNGNSYKFSRFQLNIDVWFGILFALYRKVFVKRIDLLIFHFFPAQIHLGNVCWREGK